MTKEQDEKYKINKFFFKRIYNLVKLFWVRKKSLKSWVMLALILFFTALISVLGGYLSYKFAELANLQLARDDGYWVLFVWVTLIILTQNILSAVPNIIAQRLSLDWREWLTQYLIQCYMRDRVYYDIAFTDDIDNPDQRIQEQVQPFCKQILDIPEKMFGLRGMQRLFGVVPETLTGWIEKSKNRKLSDEFPDVAPTDDLELDELWSFVKTRLGLPYAVVHAKW